ncbi:unnamed protein product [Calypogeia fissa]
MHKPRHKGRVARVLSYGKTHRKDSRKLTLCIIAFSFLLIASLSLLQVRFSKHGGHSSVNSSHDGRVWKGKFWLWGDGGDGDEERVQRMERKLGSNNGGGSEMDPEMEGDPNKSSENQEEAAEEDEGDMDNEMDMEDEEGEDFEGFGGGGGAQEWQHHAKEKRLLQVKEKDAFGASQQLLVGDGAESQSGGEDTEERMDGDGMMVEAHPLGYGAVNLSDPKKDVSRELPVPRNVAKGREFPGNSGMFSSDDEPVDEETRHRLERMSSIEDVLMLSKKESLGGIPDEMLVIKEKASKVSSDPLHPENNPLLQDPDSPGQGGGGLTKDDRALLKALKWSSFSALSSFVDQNVHLLAGSQREPDGQVEDISKEGTGTGTQLMSVVAGEHNELATQVPAHNESRRRKVIEELELGNGESEPLHGRQGEGEGSSSEILSGVSKMIESQRPRHKKKEGKKVQRLNFNADMRGWGYLPGFPGYRQEISFSKFMQGFLFDEKCSLRVFMAWMTPGWSFTVRHQRVLESLLYFHPSACVVVFSDTLELEFFRSFTDDGYRIATVMPALEELLQNTPMDVFASIFTEWRSVDLFYLHYTELLRLGALYKYGGIYLDFDMIVLKPLTSLKNIVGSEVLENGQLRPNGAIMIFEKFSPFLNRSMVEFTATYDETLRDWNGADLLDRVMKAQPDSNDFRLAILDRPVVKPPVFFFPLSSESIHRYFIAPEEDEAIAEELESFNQILAQSYAVHLWHGLTFNRVPEQGSLVDKLMGIHCLHCTDIL